MSELLISDLVKLQAWDTPTICNALDIASPDRRIIGFTSKKNFTEVGHSYLRNGKP